MKRYIKPTTDVVLIVLQNQFLTVSGSGEELQGGSNGDYVDDGTITLGSRSNGIWDEEDY